MRVIINLFVLSIISIFPLKGNFDSTLRYANTIYEGDVRSVTLQQLQSGFNFPIFSLDSKNPQLKLTFDQITAERDYYQITLIHCDAYWNPSTLIRAQYLNGSGYQDIDNVSFSNGTLTQYVHYEVQLPNDNMRPKLSGNYLLVVYRNYDESDIVLSRRLMVLGSKGAVNVTFNQSSQIEFRSEQQQINFEFIKSQNNYFIPNPHNDLKAVVLQNGDWMTANNSLKPQFIKGQTYQYNQNLGTQFDGLNEYRMFDIRSLQTAQLGVKKRLNIANQKHVWLRSNRVRSTQTYTNLKDYNGRVLYDNRDFTDNIPIESDYCFVHFGLMSEPINKEIYVYGELSDWRIQESHKMFYNEETKQYEAIIPLKMGFYNYMYGIKSEDGLDFKPMEGSFSGTENNYMVLIYHRNQALPYDELIGYGLLNTQPNR